MDYKIVDIPINIDKKIEMGKEYGANTEMEYLDTLFDNLTIDPNPQSVLNNIIIIYELENSDQPSKAVLIEEKIGKLLFDLYIMQKIDYESFAKITMYLSASFPEEITIYNENLIQFIIEQLTPENNTLLLWLCSFQNFFLCPKLQQLFYQKQSIDLLFLEPIITSSPDINTCKILLAIFTYRAEMPIENEKLRNLYIIFIQNMISSQEKSDAFEIVICMIYDLMKFTPDFYLIFCDDVYYQFFQMQIYSGSNCTQHYTLKIIKKLISKGISFMDILNDESDLKYIIGTISHQDPCIQKEALKFFTSLVINDVENQEGNISKTISILKSVHFLNDLIIQTPNIYSENNYYYIKLLYVYLYNSDTRDLRIALHKLEDLSESLVNNLDSEKEQQINGTLELINIILVESVNCGILEKSLQILEKYDLHEKLNVLVINNEITEGIQAIIDNFYENA